MIEVLQIIGMGLALGIGFCGGLYITLKIGGIL